MSSPALHAFPAGSRYRIVRRIAVGGMAELFEAEAQGAAGVTRRVAIKRILPKYATEHTFLAMFLTEARLASALHHPNIVNTLDVIESGGEFSLVMELLHGLDLLQFCRRLYRHGQSLSMSQLLHIVDRVLSALHYAHECEGHDGRPLGIVHRDVSPQNVFLTENGAVKLFDFGVAKAATALDRGTQSGIIKGKVLYLSPEQCLGSEVDRRADIYAVGVVMYQLLTGTHPFKGRTAYDTMRAIITDPLVPPSAHLPQVWPDLEAVVIRALSKDANDRYETAREMQRALNQLVQKRGCLESELGFATFVERVMKLEADPREPVTQRLPDPPDLPLDLGSNSSTPAAPLLQTDHVIVDRLDGITLIRLSGAIDEHFDSSGVAPWMVGTVVLDTSGVERITSYGIRGLLSLFEANKARLEALYHVGCSVAFVQQVGMIRKLLGGGKIASFYVPYIDPRSGNDFTELLSGEEAHQALSSRQAPAKACPGSPECQAVFDDDPKSYFCFGEDFERELPHAIASAVATIRREGQKRLVEKEVSTAGTTLWIRRPLTRQIRWSSVFRGLEGQVMLKLDDIPGWTTGGLEVVATALERECRSIEHIVVSGAPFELVEILRARRALVPKISFPSLRISARCTRCGTRRVVTLEEASFTRISADRPLPVPCSSCGGQLSAAALPAELPRPKPTQQKASIRPLFFLSIGLLVVIPATMFCGVFLLLEGW